MNVLRPETAVERTERAMKERWAHDEGRKNQARAFINRARKSDHKRRVEKQSRKRNRRRK